MKSHLTRVIWLFGVVLLLGSVIGAGSIAKFARNVEAGPNDDLAKGKNEAGKGVVCSGFVDVEGGQTALGPQQPGAVVEIFCAEGQKVRKGDPLLRIRDEAFVAVVAKAETAVKIAQSQLDQAKQLAETYAQGVKQQEQAVEAAKNDKAKADLVLKEAERSKGFNLMRPTDAEIEGYKLQVEKAKAGVNIEEAKLQSIMKNTPDAKIREAEHNVDLQKDQLRQAQEALNRCVLRAPQDGTVLRVLASLGTQYSSSSTQPAINFAKTGRLIVRAEVEQEFHNRVTLGAAATIQDDSVATQLWHGKVQSMSDAFLPPRSVSGGPEIISMGNNSRVREVIVALEPAEFMPKLGQKMRVNIGGTSYAP